MCFWYWFFFLILMFQTFNHCNFVSLQICFLTKLMMIIFVLSIIDTSWAVILINWFAFSFSMMSLQLNTHCMRIWHWFWRKLIKFFIFFYFFIKCMQPMAMALSRRCMYAKLHVTWPKSLLYIFSLVNHIDSLRIQALSLKPSSSYSRFSLSLRILRVLLFRF